MSFIWMIIVGLVAGLLARAIKPGSDPMGWIMTIVLGIVGALVGGFIASLLGINADGGFIGLVFSVIGAIILLFAYEFIMKKRHV
ncbi:MULTISPECIES: GlsB/YeaQ/YmgE family stress response membrane protein [unclassified Psychrobacter]|uniref:GlsB/YeaQ/YmgE family stress response membrane protein n=1 Tax=unclassified Psychrobacter TaxID=196806 RepID=UPI0018F34BA7|nr:MULTISPECIES: GlsB/YeaQ/YmgE family stress response membrane protein [unclassified Psychrobacter]